MKQQNGRPRRPDTSRAKGRRPAQAPLFDQQTAPLPKQEKKAGGGMRQVVLPMAAPGMEPLDAPDPGKGRRGKKRPTEAARRRQLSRGEMRRRRRRRRLLAVFFVLALMGVGAILSVTVLFKVKHIVVENLDKTTPANTGIYTENAILGALAVPLEENLFAFSVAEKQAAMELQLPYLETIRVRRRLPGTVVVQVAPATETWCAKTEAGFLVLSAGLKVLKVADAAPAELPLITGYGVTAATAGRPLTPDAADQADQLEDLLAALKAEGVTDQVTRIDMGRGTDACFVYQGRVKVVLGTFNNLEYKVGVAALLLKNETGEYLSASDRGTLDVSAQLEDTVHRFPFTPGDFTVEESEAPPPDTADSAAASGSQAASSAPASEPAQSGSAPASSDTSSSQSGSQAA